MLGVEWAILLQGHISLPILPSPSESDSAIQNVSILLLKQDVSTMVGLVVTMWIQTRSSL
eukprot:11256328-Prorocentrum_lima.AAC.1